jgi:hypothetical protein
VEPNAALAELIRSALRDVKRVSEQELFGALVFSVAGNTCCGVVGDDLMVRVPPELHQDALTRPHARETAAVGRATRGTVYVGREGWGDPAELDLWIRLGLARARALPPKKAAKKATKARR